MSDGEDIDTDIHAYHINQRNEGIDLHGVAGALMATQNLQMQTFVAGFSPGAGSSAGALAIPKMQYRRSKAPMAATQLRQYCGCMRTTG